MPILEWMVWIREQPRKISAQYRMYMEVDVTEKEYLFSIMVLLENLPRIFEAR